MALLTTTIGSYPKPEYVPVPNWFEIRDLRDDAPTTAYDRLLAARSHDHEALLDRGTREIVGEQVTAGIDIPTDGEIRREHYVYYHCRRLDGIDFESLSKKEMRGGSWFTNVPTIKGPIAAREPFLVADWRTAQSACEQPVKITVPGSLTIIDSMADAYYGNDRRLAFALADALNVEIRRLADAGCVWIQVDEPGFARYPKRALAYGIEALTRCFHGVPETVIRTVHICCGYPAELDTDDYSKADPRAYFDLADALEAAPVDVISIEDAHRHNDLRLLERFRTTKIILGVVEVARTQVETVEEIKTRLAAALNHIDRNSLIAGPDCGLIMLPRDIARTKLERLVIAAKTF